MKAGKILVLGATGYVGQRLVRELSDLGYKLRASWRSPEKLKQCAWSRDRRVKPYRVDVLDQDSLQKALEGCSTAFYLIHSMYSGKEFIQLDRDAASNMSIAAEKANIERIIYLGGLLDRRGRISKHLKSRAEVARILYDGSVPVTTLRAAMILGAGSASFEIMRYVVERLPIIITPRGIHTKTQPIAISNAINYLVGCLNASDTIGRNFDIGGPEILSYRDLIRTFAEAAGLTKRIVIPVPLIASKLASSLINVVTPLPASIARPLIAGLKSETICHDNRIREIIPQKLLTIRETIKRALSQVDYDLQKPRFDKVAEPFIPEWKQPNDPPWSGGTKYIDHRRVRIKSTSEDLWNPIIRIGGPQGWYYANWLWKLYGYIDEFMGGPGMRRGRVDCENLCPGDVVDCWRTLHIEPFQYLKLRAEMQIPGKSTLEFRIKKISDRKSELHQIITFVPRGLLGILYWKVTFPLHQQIWENMLKKIKERVIRLIVVDR